MKALFLTIQPSAVVTESRSINGDMIVYVNGQTAFNKEDRYNSSEWLTMMSNAFNRSLKK
jgi:adenine specific DNA methylase Mod